MLNGFMLSWSSMLQYEICIIVYEYVTLYTREFLNCPNRH